MAGAQRGCTYRQVRSVRVAALDKKRAANTARQRLIQTSDSNRYRAIHPDFNDR
jgi:hypothetical protein